MSPFRVKNDLKKDTVYKHDTFSANKSKFQSESSQLRWKIKSNKSSNMTIIYLEFRLRSIEYKKHTNYNLIGMIMYSFFQGITLHVLLHPFY